MPDRNLTFAEVRRARRFAWRNVEGVGLAIWTPLDGFVGVDLNKPAIKALIVDLSADLGEEWHHLVGCDCGLCTR